LFWSRAGRHLAHGKNFDAAPVSANDPDRVYQNNVVSSLAF
jgi:hypothetical protein